jgi:hypothetical protein
MGGQNGCKAYTWFASTESGGHPLGVVGVVIVDAATGVDQTEIVRVGRI